MDIDARALDSWVAFDVHKLFEGKVPSMNSHDIDYYGFDCISETFETMLYATRPWAEDAGDAGISANPTSETMLLTDDLDNELGKVERCGKRNLATTPSHTLCLARQGAKYVTDLAQTTEGLALERTASGYALVLDAAPIATIESIRDGLNRRVAQIKTCDPAYAPLAFGAAISMFYWKLIHHPKDVL